MEKIVLHIESEFKEKFNLKLVHKDDKLIIKNNYYRFTLKKREDSVELLYLWRFGLLNIVFNKHYKNMLELYKAVIDYSNENNIPITELHYNQYSSLNTTN